MVDCKYNLKDIDEVFLKVFHAFKPDVVIEPFPAGERTNGFGEPTLIQALKLGASVVATFKDRKEFIAFKRAIQENSQRSFIVNSKVFAFLCPCQHFDWDNLPAKFVGKKILVFIDPMGFQKEIYLIIPKLLQAVKRLTDDFLFLVYLPFKVVLSPWDRTTFTEFREIFKENWNGDKIQIVSKTLEFFGRYDLYGEEIHRCRQRVKASILLFKPRHSLFNINSVKDESSKLPFFEPRTYKLVFSEIDKLLCRLKYCPVCGKPKEFGKKTCKDFKCRGIIISYKYEWYEKFKNGQITLDTYC